MSGRKKMNEDSKRTGALAAQEPSFVTGHDFSRAARDAQSTRANEDAKRTGVQAAHEPGFVSGHDFSRAATDAQSTRTNEDAKRTGVQAAHEPGFVSGHDSSRAASDAQSTRALAPEGGSLAATAASAPMTLVQIRQELKNVRGKKYWRSVDELANTPEFQAAVEKEFPRSEERRV